MTTRSSRAVPASQRLAQQALSYVRHFLQIEAFAGGVLIAAALIALIMANSGFADSYHNFWAIPLSIGFGGWGFTQSLQFWVNDALMTVFFLVVGMEVRREIYDGALATVRLAALPLAAALGGVLIPAAIYLLLNSSGDAANGWAVPTATDIAFAVGVLALLGRTVPTNVRILLLAIAIIDDVAAVLIIAFFYSGGLSASGLPWVIAALALIFIMQRAGVFSAWPYVVPGVLLWVGLMQVGAHPTLAGVILGLLTPVFSRPSQEEPVRSLEQEVVHLARVSEGATTDEAHIALSLQRLRMEQREILPPVTRVQMALHPWVAFLIMPLFALANAGVTLGGVDLSAPGANAVMIGVLAALVLGKPLGILAMCFAAVKLRVCQLPQGVTWNGIVLIGLFAGIGFTMSIFIGTLAYADVNLLNASKLGVLTASLGAAVLGLLYGFLGKKRLTQTPVSA